MLAAAVAVPRADAQYFGRNKVQYDRFAFRSFETEHFTIYYYPEAELAVRDAARMAERWYERHRRTYLNTFGDRKPILFYANDADFQQTNAIGGLIGEGTGGVTEGLKQRVTMPLTGSYAETDHVLGHELVHSFQYDIALEKDTAGFALNQQPLWLMEGTAEYLSIGRVDAHTAMWMRDAALRDDLPTIRQLSTDGRYFPYRYGQALMAYIGGKYGDQAVANVYRLSGRVGPDSAIVYALGLSPDSLSREWAAEVKATYLPLAQGRTPASEAGEVVVSRRRAGGRINVAPSLSPDGRYVAYLSERDLFNVNLFVADVQSGRIVQKLAETNGDAHFDAIRFIASSGTWSPDGQKLAFVTFVEGDNELAIFDVRRGRITDRIGVKEVPAIANPAWSPDGRTVAFSGIKGGISDLYLLDLETRQVRQLTDDRYADLQPTWSPDGRTLAFSTDRPTAAGNDGTNFETLSYAEPRLATLDVTTGQITVRAPFGRALHHNPQFTGDGQSLVFISDQDGFRDVYRLDLASGATFRITNLQTGVSGITGTAPALSIARATGDAAYSVFSDNEYTVVRKSAADLTGTPVTAREAGTTPTAAVLPPIRALGSGLVASYLRDATGDLPPPYTQDSRPYRARLKLDAVAPPTVGVGVGGYYGSQVQGGVGFLFSDLLGNHNLTVVAQANGTFKDIGGSATYLNMERRLNYGAQVSHVPYLIPYAELATDGQNNIAYLQVNQRIFQSSVSGLALYPLTQGRRFELELGATRYGFDIEVDSFPLDRTLYQNGILQATDRIRKKGDAPDALYLGTGSLALVGDYSNFGFTSPVQGGRYRFQAGGYIGDYSFANVLADYRRYRFFRPSPRTGLTWAYRVMHVGNYGAEDNSRDFRIGQVYLQSSYYPTFVRGYGARSFEDSECDPATGQCPAYDRLQGTRAVVASTELRFPLIGTRELGLINFPFLPTELSLFADAGLAWTGLEGKSGLTSDGAAYNFEDVKVRPFDFVTGDDARTTRDRIPVTSVGTSLRFNVLGYAVFEVFYAYPFQRPDKGAHFGFALAPGW